MKAFLIGAFLLFSQTGWALGEPLFSVTAPVSQAILQNRPVSVPTTTTRTPRAPIQVKKRTWAHACAVALARTALIAITLTVPSYAYHETNAYFQGKEHIGAGIYLDDMETLKQHFTAEQQALFDHPQESQEEITYLLMDKLTGDYAQDPFFSFFPDSRDATSFFDGESESRGVCRHKARVLVYILNKLGIRAEQEHGPTKGGGWHVWAYLPDLDKVADPTTNSLMPAQEYRYYNAWTHFSGAPLPKGWY